jgi:uncharacterized protein (TIGR04255 family)
MFRIRIDRGHFRNANGSTFMTITFDKPPINEVVIGQAFTPVTALLAPHIGEFWTRYQNRYPNCAHAAPIVSPGQQLAFDLESSVPRIWLISEDETRLVQIQNDRFHANWRQTKAREEYIRFPPIKEEFDAMFSHFTSYLKERLNAVVTPTRYELNYINVIEGAGVSADVGKVMNDIKWMEGTRFLPPPERVSAKFQFPLSTDFGQLAVSLDPARSVASGGELLRLEISAIAAQDVVGRISFDKWVVVAHDWIVNAFKDLTTPAMHTDQWQLRGPTR